MMPERRREICLGVAGFGLPMVFVGLLLEPLGVTPAFPWWLVVVGSVSCLVAGLLFFGTDERRGSGYRS